MNARSRRQWLTTVGTAGLGVIGAQVFDRGGAESKALLAPNSQSGVRPLPLKDYEPRSMLHVPETHIPRSRFPNIDFHTHLSWIDRKGRAEVVHHSANPEEVLKVMDAKNIRLMINLTGGYGSLLEQTIQHWQA